MFVLNEEPHHKTMAMRSPDPLPAVINGIAGRLGDRGSGNRDLQCRGVCANGTADIEITRSTTPLSIQVPRKRLWRLAVLSMTDATSAPDHSMRWTPSVGQGSG